MQGQQTVYLRFCMALVMTAVCVFASSARADIEPAKKEDIRKLMKVSGTIEGLKQFRPMMLNSYSQILKAAYQDKDIPEAFWDDFFENIITDEDLDGLIEEIMPIYDKNFTHAEIRELIDAFETPAYRKWVKRLPAMMQESSEAGRRWGRRIGASGIIQQRIEKLQEKYNLGDPGLEGMPGERRPRGR